MTPVQPVKRLTVAAWESLTEALALFWWYKSDLERFLRAELHPYPEVLARLDFSVPKRSVAGETVWLLRQDESRYQEAALELMLRLSEVDPNFPGLRRLDDGEAKVLAAQSALSTLRAVVGEYGEAAAARETLRREVDSERRVAERRHAHQVRLDELKTQFLGLSSSGAPHARGRQLEVLLNELFDLYDLYPRAAYSLDHEQVDGAFTFQTDDYLLEAKWWASPLEPKHLNDFRAKVESKAKHVLGLLVAVGGFTQGAIDMHSHGTPILLMDGPDLYAILDNRIALTEVLERKRRFAAETGCPMLPVSKMVY